MTTQYKTERRERKKKKASFITVSPTTMWVISLSLVSPSPLSFAYSFDECHSPSHLATDLATNWVTLTFDDDNLDKNNKMSKQYVMNSRHVCPHVLSLGARAGVSRQTSGGVPTSQLARTGGEYAMTSRVRVWPPGCLFPICHIVLMSYFGVNNKCLHFGIYVAKHILAQLLMISQQWK